MNKLKRNVISKDFTVNYSFMDSSGNTRYSEHSPFIKPKKKPSRQRSIDIYEKDISQNEKNPFRQSLNSSSASTTISSTEYDIKLLQSKIDALKGELKDIDVLIAKQSSEINEVIDKNGQRQNVPTAKENISNARKIKFNSDDFGNYATLFFIGNHVPNGYLMKKSILTFSIKSIIMSTNKINITGKEG